MQEVAQYLASLSGKAVVINIFAGHADRSLSQTQLAELLDKLLARHPGSAVILLDHRREIRIPLPPEVVINPFNTLHHAMALIARGGADYLPGHLGGAHGGGVEQTADRGL